ncbi:hypothetical protein N7532_006818 [Penicillium argentinense]|uniref:Zn(2)-C6 fungal-type domain-containing protein n=1 Tax=Penicillium argentinense TaxID=1131581 RepID=A0A9W9FH03_9EURO|nr:uncharacterized protein N7532_006818 [Penicillium argentinense]KAJ5099817.1 hypothetical protein N7532_006818 [Penicillium argentinense]
MAEPTLRKRSRAACLSCQSRKRKCSGDQPCTTCVQSRIPCQFSAAPRKKRSRASSVPQNIGSVPASAPVEAQRHIENWSSHHPNPSTSAAGSVPSPASLPRASDSQPFKHPLEANSGASFVRKLGLRIDPARAPRLHLFAWNVGKRKEAPGLSVSSLEQLTPPASSITKHLSQAQMLALTNIYFEKVHPCYEFLERETVLSDIVQRWSNQQSIFDSPEQPVDTVLCGIAALAYLFSNRQVVEHEVKLAEAARILLDKSVLCGRTPSIYIIKGWVLRTAYLRMTASPHAAWMASCTLMHLIEAAGLHIENTDPETISLGNNTSGEPQATPGANLGKRITQPPNDLDIRRRLFGMARHLNTWISFDLGRSRVVLHGATSQSPTHSTTGGGGADLFQLLPLSESLDPTGPSPQDLPELETALTSVLNPVYTEPSLILVQCNLMLCIYRRARALNPHAPLSFQLQDRILALASRALAAARKMVVETCPWHQVANVPFQVVCTLLAIDNHAALAVLPDAMQTLREVQAAYDTNVMREAYSTAYLLVAMHQRRKEDDTRALAEVMRANASAAVQDVSRRSGGDQVGGHENGTEVQGVSLLEIESQNVQTQTQTQAQAPAQQDATPVFDAELSWLGDLVIDMPSLQNFDLDQFLLTDVPWPLPEMGI